MSSSSSKSKSKSSPSPSSPSPPSYSSSQSNTSSSTPSSSSSSSSDDLSWLFDFIVSFLQSPLWISPIDAFIDSHCSIFNNEEENKISHLHCHNDFKSLIEELLSRHLTSIGVSDEQFVSAVERAQRSDDLLSRVVFDKILAIDDFLTFKKLMFKRNCELDVEAMKETQKTLRKEEKEKEREKDKEKEKGKEKDRKSHSSPSSSASRSPTIAVDDDAHLRLALEISSVLESETQHIKNQKKQSADLEFESALMMSLLDHQRKEAEMKREQAEIEHAIALSLALEAERMKQAREKLELEGEVEDQKKKERESEEKRKNDEKDKEENERKAKKERDLEREKESEAQRQRKMEKEKEKEREKEKELEKSHSHDKNKEKPKEKHYENSDNQQHSATSSSTPSSSRTSSSTPSPTLSPTPSHSPSPSPEPGHRPRKKSVSFASNVNLSSPPSHVSSLPSLLPKSSLPPVLPSTYRELAQLESTHLSHIEAAEELFKENSKALIELQEAAAVVVEKATSTGGISDDELKRRQTVMRQQRELLIKQKNAQRAQTLLAFESDAAELFDENVKGNKGKLSKEEEDELKRKAMRDAIIQKMKNDYKDIESKKKSQQEEKVKSAVNLMNLEEQLAAAEKMRLDNVKEAERINKSQQDKSKLATGTFQLTPMKSPTNVKK